MAGGGTSIPWDGGQAIRVAWDEGGQGEAQAPRAMAPEDKSQASRTREIQAPRREDVQAPRAGDVQAPRAADVNSPRAAQGQAPRWRED